jgi:hypothetical protein
MGAAKNHIAPLRLVQKPRLCEGCYMDTGDEVLADWEVFWRDPDLKDEVLSIAICENCYRQWKVEFAKNKQGFRSRKIKQHRKFVFR